MSPLSEREKMLAGEPYLASDPELVAGRLRARRLTRRFNLSAEDERELRDTLLRELFGAVGTPITIEPPFYCDYGSQIHAGSRIFMNFGCVILDCADVTLGDDLQCGPYVQILTATHPTDAAARAAGPELAVPITIGDRVWLSGGVIVCPGVTIGDNTTIGAGSVVVHDIPANVVAVGNPCRVIRQLR